MPDITYCDNADCPFKHCVRHLSRIDKRNKYVSLASLGGVCDKYLYYLLEVIENEQQNDL